MKNKIYGNNVFGIQKSYLAETDMCQVDRYQFKQGSLNFEY